MPFKIALNSSTLFPFELDVVQQVQVAAQAGFEGIELWVKDIEAYQVGGGSLAELRAQIDAAGLVVVNAIAFFAWADADADVRARGLEQAGHEMRMLAELGCAAVAAPPYGTVEGMTPESIAAAFARLAELGRGIGVEPYLEFWGRAKRLSQLGEAIAIARMSGVSNPHILLDPFHMYTGGSSMEDLNHLQGVGIGIVHVNDYPATPPRETITDADRLFPGEGIAPSRELAQHLRHADYQGYLSLELFIGNYGSASALDVARRGYAAVHNTYR